MILKYSLIFLSHRAWIIANSIHWPSPVHAIMSSDGPECSCKTPDWHQKMGAHYAYFKLSALASGSIQSLFKVLLIVSKALNELAKTYITDFIDFQPVTRSFMSTDKALLNIPQSSAVFEGGVKTLIYDKLLRYCLSLCLFQNPRTFQTLNWW